MTILTDEQLKRLSDKPPRLWELQDFQTLNGLIASHREQAAEIARLEARVKELEEHLNLDALEYDADKK